MNYKPETIEWAKNKLSLLANLHGYPKEEKHIALYAKALLNIAHPGAVLARWNHAPVNETCMELGPDTLDAIRIDSEKIGSVNPMDWLLENAFEENKFMPPPLMLRAVFDKVFPCADGITPKVEEE